MTVSVYKLRICNNVPLKSFHVVDLSELYIAMDAMRDVINEWIEENTDEQDKLNELSYENGRRHEK